MTKYELCQLVLTPEELKSYDIALPYNFVQDCQNLLNVDPTPFTIWCYKDSIGGYPINLAERFYETYSRAQQLWDMAQNVMYETQQRGDHADEDGKPYQEFLKLAYVLDAMNQDRINILEPPVEESPASTQTNFTPDYNSMEYKRYYNKH